jgi:hypothetical protein
VNLCAPAVEVMACVFCVDQATGEYWPAIALVTASGTRQIIAYDFRWTSADIYQHLTAAAAEYRLPISHNREHA